jgi:hypothetical protein
VRLRKLLWLLAAPVSACVATGCSDGSAGAGGTGGSASGAGGDWYQPEVATTWQWQLQPSVGGNAINTSYDVDLYDIDLSDSDESVIAQLHRDGRRVICYFSAGSYEDFRDDADRFQERHRRAISPRPISSTTTAGSRPKHTVAGLRLGSRTISIRFRTS